MRKLLLFLFMCVCTGVNAQRIDKPGEPYDYYCKIRVIRNNIGIIEIPNSDSSYKFVDEKGENIKFNNHSDLLLYMSKRGWDHVETYTIIDNYTLESIIKKKVNKDDEATNNINISERKEKK